ncbi:chaperone NapD [Helicobacter cetorum]|uniref:chaperone NapD n=1 Tax=Helicobacter cetorum TaxID=138563 RepID=UPI000CF0B0BC|nr:chaperone NapD [Helicobacter cetorum]
MNISSVVLECESKNLKSLKEKIGLIKGCSVELEASSKLVVVIESENLDTELKIYKTLEALEEVSQIYMAFSYQNLELEREKAEHSNALESIENAQKAQDFCYYGDIYRRY